MTKAADTILLFILLISLVLIVTSGYVVVTRLIQLCIQRRATRRHRNLRQSQDNLRDSSIYIDVESNQQTAENDQQNRHQSFISNVIKHIKKPSRRQSSQTTITEQPPPPTYNDIYPPKVNAMLQTDIPIDTNEENNRKNKSYLTISKHPTTTIKSNIV